MVSPDLGRFGRVFADNTRDGNGQKGMQFSTLGVQEENVLHGLEGLKTITPEFLSKYGITLVGIRGGDGSLSILFDAIAHMPDGTPPPAVFLGGGGSANTLLKEIRRQGTVPIPTEPEHVFSPELYEAHLYSPPELRYQASGDHPSIRQSIVYLYGACHLSVMGTTLQDRIAARGIRNPQVTYTLAGVGTLAKLFGPHLQPQLVSYEKDQQIYSAEKEDRLVCLTIAMPRLGMFQFREQISPNELWVLTNEGNPDLARVRYMLMALIGVLPGGPDLALKMGLLTRRIVEKVTIQPDPAAAREGNPNSNYDGQLCSIEGLVEVYRPPEPERRLHIITLKVNSKAL